jgi:hypothetical protein
MTHFSLLRDLIDLHSALQRDNSPDLDMKKRRDRSIGRALQQQRKQPSRQLGGWLDRVELAGWTRDGQEAAQLYHLLCFILVVAGLLSGWGLARAVLHYTGAAPINVVHVLGLLVLPQLLLLVLWLVAAVPHRIPLFSSLQSALRVLNPGRLTGLVARFFPERRRRKLELLWDSDKALLLAPAARWLFSLWSQLFAFWFNVGLLLALFYLVSFSDLAFAWSTTLNLDSHNFHTLLNALSWPWHTLFPQAVPSLELVEISRYYRLDEGSLANGLGAAERAARLGGWWPFLVAAVVCYGLLPRLLTLGISWQRFRHHLGRALPRLPGAPELLARMNSPLITTAALRPEAAAQVPPASEVPAEAGSAYRLKCAVVDWSGAIEDHARVSAGLKAMGIEPLDILPAGGARSTAQDQATAVSLCKRRAQAVTVVAKAWEPPLLEFVDFVQEIRNRCGGRQAIVIALWGGASGVSERDREAWQLTLAQLKDPDLHLENIGTAV